MIMRRDSEDARQSTWGLRRSRWYVCARGAIQYPYRSSASEREIVKYADTQARSSGTPVGKITQLRLRLRDTGKTSQPEGWVKLGQGPLNWQPFHISFSSADGSCPGLRLR